MKRRSDLKDGGWLFYLITLILAVLCFVPMWITLVSSFTSEATINAKGYSLLIREFSTETYRFLIQNKGPMLLKAYGITFLVVILGTIYSLTVTTCFAYAVSQKKSVFRYANALSFFAWFTTIFSGGVLPWYIVTTRYYHLQNNIWALFVPSAMSVFNMMVLRSNFRAIPEELYESARLDGAGNLAVFVKIAIPLNKVALVTVTLFYALGYWNDFYLSMYLITKTDLYTVQKLLYQMMSNISALMSNSSMASAASQTQIPTVTARMCMTVMTTLPVLVFYPFAQKYFVQGITVGAVKG